MRTRAAGSMKRRIQLGALAALALTLAIPALAIDQERAQNNTGLLNNRGSDNSMDAATGSAMRAMMSLAALNIPGAFSNGYRAYGQFINSEKMDAVEIKALKRRHSMSSIGSNVARSGVGDSANGSGGDGGGISGKQTTFSRLDPSYLYKGTTGETAAEFEKASGMKRETFLKHLAGATDSDLNYNDPDLLGKLEARFQAFKADVQNPDFRTGLEKAEGMFPQAARAEVLGKFSSMYAESWAGGGADSSTSLAESTLDNTPSALALAPEANAETNAQNPIAALATSAEPGRTVASAESPTADREGVYIGIGGSNTQEMLNDFLNSPTAADSDSLFVKVSKRYRILTPALLGRADIPRSR